MLQTTDDDLNVKIQDLLREYKMDLSELISVIYIYCQDLSVLKEDQVSNNYRYMATQISKEKWAIVDKHTMCIQTILGDELTAYRKARIYSTIKN